MKTPRNVRLSLVYEDSDFIKRSQDILQNFLVELTARKSPKHYIDKVSDGSIRSAGIRNYASKELQDKYYELLKEYELTSAEFTNFFTREEAYEEDEWKLLNQDSPIVINIPSPEDETMTISIHPSATRQDLIDSWEGIRLILDSSFRNRKKRIRGPGNLKLLWAIHKARKEKSYKEISILLNENKLPFYRREKGDKANYDESYVRQYYSDYKDFVVR